MVCVNSWTFAFHFLAVCTSLPFPLRPSPFSLSAEGHEFIVDRKCACVSKTIEAMLAGGFTESKGEIKFPEISTNILEKVIQYLYYKVCMCLPHIIIMPSHFTLLA